EVARLATTVVLLDKGHVAAVGAVDEVTSRLDLLPLTGGPDAGAVLSARVARHDADFNLTVLDCPAGDISVPRLDLSVGEEVRVRIRASDVLIGVRPPEGLSALNVLSGTIDAVAPAGESAVILRLDCHGQGVIARVTRKSADALGL